MAHVVGANGTATGDKTQLAALAKLHVVIEDMHPKCAGEVRAVSGAVDLHDQFSHRHIASFCYVLER